MAIVSITVNAESADIAALVALGAEISSALDKWLTTADSLGVPVDFAEITFANAEFEED